MSPKKAGRRILRPLLVGGTLGLLALVVLVAALVFLSVPDVSTLKKYNPETTALIQLRQKQARREGHAFVVRREWVSFDRIPSLLKESVRITEDFSFYWHKGIDYGELKESLKRDLREGRLARGGSTITQQLAKNLYLSTEKSLLRKLKESVIARRLESALSKDRIFEIYLNSIELGPGIFGVQAAADYYFHKDVEGLDPEEIVRLTAVIPRPLTTDPRGDDGWLRWRYGWILGKLRLHKVIDESDYRRLAGRFE
jgi:monofunctional biosynthetic peptidoglycan transglycosylase